MKDAFTQPFLGHVCFHVTRALEQASDLRLEWDVGWAGERASTGLLREWENTQVLESRKLDAVLFLHFLSRNETFRTSVLHSFSSVPSPPPRPFLSGYVLFTYIKISSAIFAGLPARLLCPSAKWQEQLSSDSSGLPCVGFSLFPEFPLQQHLPADVLPATERHPRRHHPQTSARRTTPSPSGHGVFCQSSTPPHADVDLTFQGSS